MLSFARYHNYTTEEQLKTFEDTNRYDSTMSKRDALSAKLCYSTVTIEENFKEEKSPFYILKRQVKLVSDNR